jgi:transcriptional regulator with PAS, ATPase and Fis domain
MGRPKSREVKMKIGFTATRGLHVLIDESHNELYLVDKHGEVETPDTHSIKQAKMDGEDCLNDFIAIIESRMEEELSQTQGVQSKDCVRHTYQHYINKAVALRNEWLEQCDSDLEVLLNG